MLGLSIPTECLANPQKTLAAVIITDQALELSVMQEILLFLINMLL